MACKETLKSPPTDEGKITPPLSDSKDPSATKPHYAQSKKFIIASKKQVNDSRQFCIKSLKKMPNRISKANIKKVCAQVSLERSCYSKNKQPIFHYDKKGISSRGKKILALSLIHGDEHGSGTITSSWMNRLDGLKPRNTWRVLPVINPDGWDKSTRVNANGVDINRNFPSKDWEDLAYNWWRDKKKSDPRRYPGPKASSESETNCLLKHINNFKPDFIISIHTPLGLLDFDGPKVRAPSTLPLPWQKLGNFPGSLGRYMWKDHRVPVLTIELKGSRGIAKLEEFDRLQDISGTVAIRAGKLLNKNRTKN